MNRFMISIAFSLTLSFAGSSFALTQNEINGLTHGCQSTVDPNEVKIEVAYDEASKVVAVRQTRHAGDLPVFQELRNSIYLTCKFFKSNPNQKDGAVTHFDSYYQCQGKPSAFLIKLSVPVRGTNQSISQCQLVHNN